MGKKIYIKNLTFTTTEQDLQAKCQEIGSVTDVRIIKDRETGKSRGFGFVTFADEDSARKAIGELNGQNFQGRELKVEEAIDKNNSSGRFSLNS